MKDVPDCRMALIRLKLVSWGEEEEESEEETDMVEDSKWSDGLSRTVNPGPYKYVPQALRHPWSTGRVIRMGPNDHALGQVMAPSQSQKHLTCYIAR